MRISAKITGAGWEKFKDACDALGEKKARKVYRAVINRKGAELRKAAVQNLPKQVGIPVKTIKKALGKAVRASDAQLRYSISTEGGYISAKFFRPGERGGGVVYKPRGKSTFVPSGFMTAGPAGARKPVGMGGHVFAPRGGEAGPRAFRPGASGRQWGRPIAKEKSDVRIPDEMQTGKTFKAYKRIEIELEPAIAHAITRLTKGSVT